MRDDPPFELIERAVEYQGFFRLERIRVRHRTYRGGWSPVIEREVFERGDAACILLFDPHRDEVVLVEQFRAAALAAPGGPWVVETVAGIVGAGETPEAVARREAEEEAGCRVGRLTAIADYLVSPGGSSERVFLYCGEVDAGSAARFAGLAEEGEDIRVLVMPAAAAIAGATAGRIGTAHAILALLWLAGNRDRLLAEWGAAAGARGEA